jgi:apolipoprotein N-acyltransferase
MLAGAALLLGIASVFGFAPFGAWAVSLLTLAGLFALWQRAATPHAAAWLGYAYGIGLFGAGTSWTYVALSTFGGMIPILAAIGTASFCLYLALFPALAGWIAARLAPVGSPARLAIAAGAWTVAEWLHSPGIRLPWLATGYAQVGGPFAGFVLIGGAFLVGLAVAAAAALLVYAQRRAGDAAGTLRAVVPRSRRWRSAEQRWPQSSDAASGEPTAQPGQGNIDRTSNSIRRIAKIAGLLRRPR